MLRFPNPGSDIARFIDTFNQTFSDNPDSIYELDDISYIMAKNNSATAVGSIGLMAFKKSQKKDKSLNSIYNQAKSYVESYRWLGWIYAESLNYIYLTALGKLILTGKYDNKKIFTTCFLCWGTPNKNISTSSNYKGYAILNILKTSLLLEGKISRDEIILGPMNEEYEKIQSSVNYIKQIRDGSINRESELRKSSISVNTQKNYTRLVLSGLKYAGLMEKKDKYFYLTDKGRRIALTKFDDLLSMEDFDDKIKIKLSFKWFLQEASIKSSHEDNDKVVFGSPYQMFNPDKIDDILEIIPRHLTTKLKKDNKFLKEEIENNNYDYNVVTKITQKNSTNEVTDNINDIRLKLNLNTEDLLREIGKYKKEEFYPFVGNLFKILGFKVDVSRNGQNAQRADIVLSYEGNRTIPVEVKSKTEVEKINIKSVEQAIENKIILQSRKYKDSMFSDSTFIVGFNYPDSKRISQLINACYEVYKIKVVLFSSETLINMAKTSLLNNKKWDIEKMITTRGEIRIE